VLRAPKKEFRKPLFYPLNYGNNDLERINGLNGDEQAAVAARRRFFEGRFALDYQPLSEIISLSQSL
jgi:hypothetical protein